MMVGNRGLPWAQDEQGRLVLYKPVRSDVELILPRAIYTESQTIYLEAPKNARGVIIQTRLHSSTGTFAAGEGLQVSCREHSALMSYSLGSVLKSKQGFRNNGGVTLVLYPGISLGESINVEDNVNETYLSGTHISSNLRVDYLISGAFTEGQGIDMRSYVTWIF